MAPWEPWLIVVKDMWLKVVGGVAVGVEAIDWEAPLSYSSDEEND
jgi:hypothetical protein